MEHANPWAFVLNARSTFSSLTVLLLGALAALPVHAQLLEEIIVTGTRVEGRAYTEMLSPVDVLAGDSLNRQAAFDFTEQLRNITPSFNTQRYPIADGTSFIRPANLRNLPPDQTLVLLNGSRRHKSALVNLQTEPFGTVNQGAQSVDFSLIPSIAIQRIEVLRDGASAQYGSDAIAGVINVILRDDTDGFAVDAQYGEYREGDGENWRVGANVGVALGDDGFFNVSGEFFSANITSRGSPRPDAVAVAEVVGADLVPFNGFGQRWGDPDVESARLFINSEFPLAASMAVYGHASYADADTLSGFFYRAPVGVPGVAPRATLMVDSDGDGAPDPVDQAIVDDIIAQGLDPTEYVTADPGSPSGFVALNPIHPLFPGGYNPSFGAEITDVAVVAGVRGETAGGLFWDVSGSYGENEISYILDGSINPGLGIHSPLSFRPGDLSHREVMLNAEFVRRLELEGLAQPLNLAFGAEYRDERYRIFAGDPASFEFGPAGILFGVGSDGFQGDSPDAAGSFSRDSVAAYVDVEADLSERLTIGGAARGESYDDFGETFDWKLAARFGVSDLIALRGTASTGFRAPTPGQINTLDVTTTADPQGNLVPLGTFPVTSPAAIALGATPLQPEDSFNLTAGLVLTPAENLALTLDLYQIEVEDRIALSTINIVPGSPEQQALIDAGVPGATLLGTVSFFTNAFDTTVRGIDLALTTRYDLRNARAITLDFRHSWHEQEVDRVLAGTIDEERAFDLENQLPHNRSIVSIGFDSGGRFNGLLRLNYYDGWQDLTFGELGSFGSKTLVDLEANFVINDRFDISVGGENVFDTYPDDETNSVLTFLGATRPISSPFGFNGARWYLRATATF